MFFLFHRIINEVVSSRDGFGIGLYQSAALARRQACRLQLSENRPQRVSFELRPHKPG